jgi:hemerythrin superfamily protein
MISIQEQQLQSDIDRLRLSQKHIKTLCSNTLKSNKDPAVQKLMRQILSYIKP